MIFLTGDLHGWERLPELGAEMWPEGNNLMKTDYLIILGDFGLIWNNSEANKSWLDWLNKKPWTTLFVDGNHENFNMLNSYPVTNWCGGKVHMITPSIIHLMRGQVFNLQGKKFFTFGGATSIDKEHRKPYVSWWPEEVPSQHETLRGALSLISVNNKVDYVLTHTCPNEIVKVICGSKMNYELQQPDPVCNILDYFYELLEFDHWYFGHFHEDRQINDKFTVMYEDIKRIV